jgi:hypothetical protein
LLSIEGLALVVFCHGLLFVSQFFERSQHRFDANVESSFLFYAVFGRWEGSRRKTLAASRFGNALNIKRTPVE